MEDVKFNKAVVFINSLVPLALLCWDAAHGNLGANPLEFFLRTSGVLALVFILISLAITPLRKYTGWNWLVKFRRMLGLYGFFYAFLHFIAYVGFDRSLSLSGTISDIWQRPFIAVGMASFFLMIPLAVTSTNSMIKRLGGKNWQKLHRLSYLIAIGGVVHFYMIVKSDLTYPLLFALILAGLLVYRIYPASRNTPKKFAADVRE